MGTYILTKRDDDWALLDKNSQFVLFWFSSLESGIRTIKPFLQKEGHKLIIQGAKEQYKKMYVFPLPEADYEEL